MRNFKPTKVVALDTVGQPLTRDTRQWTASFNQRKGTLTLSSGSHRQTYDLSADVRYLAVVDQKNEVDLGKTLGRMALTGIGVNGLEHGKGVAGAVLDLAVRGTSNTSWLRCELVLKDLSVVSFEARADHIKSMPSLLRAAGNGSRDRLEVVNDTLRRLTADGERVLPELDQELSVLQADVLELQHEVEEGGTFAARDNARARLALLREQIADKQAVRGALLVDLAMAKRGPMHGLVRRIFKGLMWIAVASAAFVAFMFYATQRPAGEAQLKAQPGVAVAPAGSPARLSDRALAAAKAKANTQPPVTESTATVAAAAPLHGGPAEERRSHPSFDCSNASTRVEKMICADADLGDADRGLAEAFKQALRRAEAPKALRQAQAEWRRQERDFCASRTCVASAYAKRIMELDGANRQ